MALNTDDVIRQLEAAGLQIDHLVIGKIARCKVEGDREKRGWYALHEVTLDNGDLILVGAGGVWHGDNNNKFKLNLSKYHLSAEQQAAMRARLREDQKRADGLRKLEAEKAAEKAERKWRDLSASGEHDYLTRKGVQAYALRFAPDGTRIDYEYDGKVRESDISGALAVPMCDVAGRIWGLQWILSKAKSADRIQRLGRDKEYWPQGLDKRGKFHHLGGVPDTVLFVAEGYATAASVHAATGLPTVVAFDAGNLGPVAQALHKKYRRAKIVLLADDDAYGKCPSSDCQARLVVAESTDCPSCGKAHYRKNTGVDAARTAALAVGGLALVPKFANEPTRRTAWVEHARKLTDYNDLHEIEGLAAVRAQIEAALAAEGITPAPVAVRGALPKGGGGNTVAMPIQINTVRSLPELQERFVLIYGEQDLIFDRECNKLVKLKDVQNITLSREVYSRWAESPDKQIATLDNVGFDPTGTDAMVTCNTYSGWPTVPKEGSCEALLELLWFLCSAEPNADEVYQWLIRWLAYPIQHPGAKMASAAVMHGKQGTGKSMFFKAWQRIYGKYGLTINQSAVENPRNTWLSSRLAILAEEVIARKEMHHIKNALKDLVTGDTVYVDPKFVNAYAERNHVNIVFLSNETMPVILEDDDRRHLVIWTPDTPLSENTYRQVKEEIDAGGIAALHYHLANLDLTGFHPNTKPPMTRAKRDLIDLSLDSTTRFYRALVGGDIDGIRSNTIALSTDLYKIYTLWCHQIGTHAAPMPKLLNTLERKHNVLMARKRYSDGYKTFGPHAICFLPELIRTNPGETVAKNPECPVDLDEKAWIWRHVDAFRTAVRDFKGSNYG
jgi:putative DNA primase/helicase